MAQSVFVEWLDEVQSSLTAILRPIGFRRRGRTFNRSAEDGIVQVINLQTGQSPIGGNKPLPPDFAHLRSNLYGNFTVNLGIHIKEIWEHGAVRRYPSTIQDYDCQIRTRLGHLSERKDYWWSLDAPADSLVNEVSRLLLNEGVAFLERFETRPAILAGWIAMNDGPERLSSRSRVDVAIMVARNGDEATAMRLLKEQINATSQQGDIDYVRRLARNLGLEL